MKKFLAFLLGILMICSAFVITSCDEKDGDGETETTKPSVSTIVGNKKETTAEEETTTEAVSLLPTGYQLYSDGTITFAYPKNWSKTDGSTVILQNTGNGNNITVVYEAKTDYYENLTKTKFQEELKPALESIGMSISNETVTQLQNDNGMKITEIAYSVEMQGKTFKQTLLITTIGQDTYTVTLTEMKADNMTNQTLFHTLGTAN